MSIKSELLILLHGRYPDRVTKGELLKSLSRRSPGSVNNALRALISAKRCHGNAEEGYVLTRTGHEAAVAAIAVFMHSS